MLGLLVNFGTIVLGGLIGLRLNKGIPERLSELMLKGMGLVVLYIGISGMFDGTNSLIIVISIAIGSIVGGLIDLDDKVNRLSDKVEKKMNKGKFSEGFTTATFVFLVGAMAIVGGLKAGLGDNTTLYTKAIIDGITAIVFATTLGFGVMFSAIPVTIYQGIFVLIAKAASGFLNDYMINEMSCVGGLLIFAIGLNLLGLTKIKVMNLLPAMFIPIILCLFM